MKAHNIGLSKYLANMWVVSNPHILYRFLRGFFRALVLKKNTLRVIELFPTFACQASCDMCSVDKYMSRQCRMLNMDDYRDLARQGADIGATVMTVLGGEPLLYDELAELVITFREQGFYTHVVSNGLALTKQRVDELKAARLDCLYFSLESMDAVVNDRIRGMGHFDKTMENLALVKAAGITTGLSTVMFPGGLDMAEKVIQFCHEQGINASGGQIAPVGKAEGVEVLSGEEFVRVRDMLRKYPNLTYDWAFSYWLKPRCPAGKEKVGVTCYGDVIGCSYNPISFGNVLKEPLKAILKRMGSFSQFAKNFQGCLTSEDEPYIRTYLKPAYSAKQYPVSYLEHENISVDSEPELFKEDQS